eukprot:4532948-Alexandrium_andersonii.AAC.1
MLLMRLHTRAYAPSARPHLLQWPSGGQRACAASLVCTGRAQVAGALGALHTCQRQSPRARRRGRPALACVALGACVRSLGS